MFDRKERRNRTRFLIASIIILVIGISLMSSQMTMNFQESDMLAGLPREYQISIDNNTLIWETIGSPQSMDPHVSYDGYGPWIAYNVYETLYTYPWDSAATDTLVPLLAASDPVVSADGLNYTITLREGITFHDGTPFNASCVKWNIERAVKIFFLNGPVWMILEPLKGGAVVEQEAFYYGSSSPEFIAAFDDWVANSGAIEVMDDYIIRFVLEESYAPFIAALTYSVGSMISPSFQINHASSPAYASWEDYGVDYGEYENYMAEHTCGTGPYMLANWLPAQYIEMDIYTNYWRVADQPYAGSIEKIYIYTNVDDSGRMLNLTTGAIDGCYWPIVNAPDIWDSDLEQSLNPEIHVSTGGASYVVLNLGYNMGTLTLPDETIITSPYENKNFRKCSSYAFNYTALINTAVNGLGIQGQGPIPYGMFGHNETSYSAYYNITQAVEYWNAAVLNPDFLQTLDDLDYNITFYYNSGNTLREQTLLTLADGLNMVIADDSANTTFLGSNELRFIVQPLEWSAYLDYVRLDKMPLLFVGWAPDYADPDNYVYPFCYQYGAYAIRIGFDNSMVSENCLLARAELNNTKRMEYYNIINDICAEEVPYLWPYQATEFRTWRSWLHGDGLIYNPMHEIYFYHLYKEVIDVTPPQIDSPLNIFYDEFTTGHSIAWHPIDVTPQSYVIYLDGIPVKSGAWNSSSEVISISVDGLDLGEYNYTIVVNDIGGRTASDEVLVTVVDGTPPLIDGPADFQYNEFTTGHSITWHPSDAHPIDYIVYFDSTPIKSGDWNSSSEDITISVDGLGLGTYNYTLIVTDIGVNVVSDEVMVSVVDAIFPIIDTPADIEYEEYTTGHSITWQPTDDHPQSYIIYLDGTSVKSGAWNSSSEIISISVDDLGPGEYNYTIIVTDAGENWVSDTVIVTVTEVSSTTTTTTTSDTTHTNATTTLTDVMTPITILIGLGSGTIIIIVIIIIMKKKQG